MHYVNENGELVAVHIFVACLPYSRYAYVEPTLDEKMNTWINCNANMLEYFHGAPKRIVCDNLRTAVVSHPKEGEIILTDRYLDFAEYYSMAIMPAAVRKPNQKASVENLVKKIHIFRTNKSLTRNLIHVKIMTCEVQAMGEKKQLNNKWDKLLSCERTNYFNKTNEMYYSYMNQWEEDYQQITTSYEFRRLKDKTQVFPLEKNDFVRDRLTHSIEVSGIAKQIFYIAIKNLEKNGYIISDDFINTTSLLACSGLLHDIGNPPFGHSGEKAIRDWFFNKFNDPTFTFEGMEIGKLFDDSNYGNYKVYKTDLVNFEGNAQAIRILLREGSQFNVTESLLASLIKYPNQSISYDPNNKKVYKHKIGYYESERDKVEEILNKMGLFDPANKEYYRHPLCYILEAADDIAYLTADLEDGIKKKIISVKDIIQDLENKITNEVNNYIGERKTYEQVEKILSAYNKYYKTKSKYEKSLNQLSFTNILLEDLKKRISKGDNEIEVFDEWIGVVRRWLIYCAGYAFSCKVNDFVNNKENHELLSREDVFHKYTHKFLREIEQKHLFPETTILEIQGEKIINSLLELFIPSVINYDTSNKQTAHDKKVLSLISNGCIDSYRKVVNNKNIDDVTKLYYRFLMVTDYISGMTDNYAKELYKKINGLD